jgi:hypothetical protein
MQFHEIANARLISQHIAQPHSNSTADIVAYMGAMQAQDYAGALWSIGLRSVSLTRQAIEKAIENRTVIRTWPMRGTIHFLAADDARWITQLTAPRTLRNAASRERALNLDTASMKIARATIEKSLRDGPRTRGDIMQQLDAAGESTAQQRGYHILWRLAHEGVICFGPRQGKQPTFALLDQWLPKTRDLSGDNALGEIAARYFVSHGPATLKDFAGWSSLPITAARRGIDIASDRIAKTTISSTDYWHAPNQTIQSGPSAFLLPGFDEFMLGYKDRTPALILEQTHKIIPGGNGMFKPTVVIDGQVVGTWKKIERKNTAQIELDAFESFDSTHHARLERAIRRYGEFLDLDITLI